MFSEKQISEFKEAFSFIDQDGDGIIDNSDLNQVLNSLGKEGWTTLEEGINFTMFLTMMGEQLSGFDDEHSIGEAFRDISDYGDFISLSRFKECMMNKGSLVNRLSEREFDDLCKDLISLDSSGKIDWNEQIIKKIILQ